MDLKRFFIISTIIIFTSTSANAASSMFNKDGQYSGSWKQMTNVSSSPSSKSYSSSAYSSSTWYANNQKQRRKTWSFYQTCAAQAQTPYSAANYTEMNTVPFRYNTLNYTRIRKVKGGYGDYNAKCSDIGDVSFCH